MAAAVVTGGGDPGGLLPQDAGRALDRALGAIWGGAIGDALGMPTQTLDRAEIARRYGVITGFLAPHPGHPVSHGLAAGAITDDTEQTLLLAEALVAGRGRLRGLAWPAALRDWERSVAARGLSDLLGPSTTRALAALEAGVPAAEAGRHGVTNGAAMRVAPVGILMPPDPLSALIERVADTARPTHGTGVAIAAAAAVAAAISAGVEGADWRTALRLGLQAAARAAGRGYQPDGGPVAAGIRHALVLAREPDPLSRIAAEIGTSVAAEQSVPAAFGILAVAGGDPWTAGLMAAGLGGDTDTMGAIAGSMGGACAGLKALPAEAVATIARVNALAPEPVVAALLALRTGA